MCGIKRVVSFLKVSVTSSILDQWTALKKKKKKLALTLPTMQLSH